eukprot:TRINITY_DN6101_c0_g1_i1.p2 TRINITY_DN6101_c0_g1~~TRINITY_DN6101_c0_g1_i1.p2  ORF type:complete len:178 (+),score=95.23 TRINITY_DN6101_c0_g1_i1:26-535(+)
MAQAQRPYINALKATLTASVCLRNFGSQLVERHNKPEIEAGKNKELLLQPVIVSRNKNERVLIESSVNSVRVSICIKQSDEVDNILVKKFMRFLMQRAEHFIILRRKPIKGYDISFLINSSHCEAYLKHKLVEFIITFMEEIDKEISEMKTALNARARAAAESFLKEFV